MSSNMRIWEKLCRTDPKATKPFKRAGGFSGTQIDPYFRYKIMTEQFGPCGQGWGYETTDPIIADGMIFIGARVWYIDPETSQRCESGTQYGGDVLLKPRRDGTAAMNDEAMKMAVTDAVGKALSLLGLGADIYTGQWDDSKYREESEVYWRTRNDPNVQPDAIAAFEEECRQKLVDVADVEGLDAIWRNGTAARLREIGVVDRAAQQRITALFSERKAEILNARQEEDPGEQKPEPEAPPPLDDLKFETEINKKIAGATTVDRLKAIHKTDIVPREAKLHPTVRQRLLSYLSRRKGELQAKEEPKAEQPAEQPARVRDGRFEVQFAAGEVRTYAYKTSGISLFLKELDAAVKQDPANLTADAAQALSWLESEEKVVNALPHIPATAEAIRQVALAKHEDEAA